MKYLVSLILAIPLITSCTVIQEEYYEPNYYNPPPRVEVVPDYNHRHYHDGRRTVYRPAPRGRVYHGHTQVAPNAVIINPRAPQVRAQQNVHGHNGNAGVVVRPSAPGTQVQVQPNVHGHNGNAGTVVRPPAPGAQVQVQQNVHGHNGNGGTVVRPPAPGAQVQVQQNVHGHAGEPKKVHGHHESNDEVQQNSHGHN